MNSFFDVHCHLTDEEDYLSVGGVKSVIDRAKEAGIEKMIVSGFDLASSKKAREIARENGNAFFCAGFQPEELRVYEEGKASFEADLREIEALAKDEKCVAVGEIGLDYHFSDNPSKEWQKKAFVAQLRLAKEANLPAVIHSRDACADTLGILRENRDCLCGGFLMHCFSYAAETVAEFVSLGAYFSFGGVATFKKAEKVKKAALAVPKDRILTETDSPYLTPEPYRGTFPNEPKNAVHTARYLAALRQESEEEFCKTVEENAMRLFPALFKR